MKKLDSEYTVPEGQFLVRQTYPVPVAMPIFFLGLNAELVYRVRYGGSSGRMALFEALEDGEPHEDGSMTYAAFVAADPASPETDYVPACYELGFYAKPLFFPVVG